MAQKKRILFRLHMPNVGSWNGQWSGQDRNYILVRSLSDAKVQALNIPTSWRYNFGDGWCASVSAKVMASGERKPKSDGFCSYEWMVENIIKWGTPECQHEWERDPHSGQQGWEGEWERCRFCLRSQRVSVTPI